MALRHKRVVAALLRVHSELTQRLESSPQDRQGLRVDIWHLEATIRLLQSRRRTPNPWFKHGSLFPAAIAVLKAADRPLSAPEITRALLRERGITDAHPAAVYDLRRSVERSLTYNRGRNIIAIGSNPVHWKLAEQCGKPR
jgi:hypothetical protein